jgi:hypothetical protein
MFQDCWQDQNDTETFVEAITRCTLHDMEVFELTCGSDTQMGSEEIGAIVERWRHRLGIAAELDELLGPPPTRGERRQRVEEEIEALKSDEEAVSQ